MSIEVYSTVSKKFFCPSADYVQDTIAICNTFNDVPVPVQITFALLSSGI